MEPRQALPCPSAAMALILVCILPGVLCPAPPPQAAASLREVARSDRQWTGVAIAPDGRLFASFPRGSAAGPSLVEVAMSGATTPYPDADWNRWEPGLPPTDHFICVQSVVADDAGGLWVLDAANPEFQGVVPGGAKLVRVDLKTNRVSLKILFDATAAPRDSYLNDVRIDTKRRLAYITDSGLGAILVADLKEGAAWRVLEGHPSTRAEETVVTVEGREFKKRVHADAVALAPKGDWLYYQALAGRTLYRVPTRLLRDPLVPDDRIGAAVEKVAEPGPSGGLAADAEGNLYLASIEKNAVTRVDPKGNLSVLAQDPVLKWPDSIALSPEGLLFVTTSQLHLAPKPEEPYRIFCIKYK